jgi:hypothetical protein
MGFLVTRCALPYFHCLHRGPRFWWSPYPRNQVPRSYTPWTAPRKMGTRDPHTFSILVTPSTFLHLKPRRRRGLSSIETPNTRFPSGSLASNKPVTDAPLRPKSQDRTHLWPAGLRFSDFRPQHKPLRPQNTSNTRVGAPGFNFTSTASRNTEVF